MDIIRPVTKWARILKPQDVPATVNEAFYQLKTVVHGRWR
jgi:thiamine pyrophosphate-dependent acetolactate synthase large subunit-like protein